MDLRGTVSNRFGVGATVRGSRRRRSLQVRQLVLARGYMSSSEPMVHFGLGGDTSIARLTVSWPSGHVQSFANLGVDRRYTITETKLRPPPPPAPAALSGGQFAEVSEARGLAVTTSHEEPINETSVQPLLPIRPQPPGPALAHRQQ